MQDQPKILISEDLSCIGQVSMGVTLPILSGLGYNPCLLPTALLSTHTGGFGENTNLDLSDEMEKILKHWETLDLQFSGMYFGYLGLKPIQVILDKIKTLKVTDDSLTLIDPVMADNGKLYKGFTANYVAAMKQLIQYADIATPNITEAQLLLNEPIKSQLLTREEVNGLAVRLGKQFQIPEVVITGVTFKDKIAVVGYHLNDSTSWEILRDKMPGNYFGTGDIFASILLGLTMRGVKTAQAAETAMQVIETAIKKTNIMNTDIRFGVNYGEEIGKILE